MKRVVSNTTPLIALARADAFELLRAVFREVWIPEAVRREVEAGGSGAPGEREAREALREGWLIPDTVPACPELTTLGIDLDEGEAESIALALRTNADLILLDDRKARARAKALGLSVTGTVGVLLIAQDLGLPVEVDRAIESLRANGFYLAPNVLAQIAARRG